MNEKQNGVWIFNEWDQHRISDVTLSLIKEGRKIADQLNEELILVILGYNVGEVLHGEVECGIDKIICIDRPFLEDYHSEIYTDVISQLLTDYHPSVFLFSSTEKSKILASRIAARNQLGLTADCTELQVCQEDGLLHMIRPAFGGTLMAEIIAPSKRPQMATVNTGISIAEQIKKTRCEFIHPNIQEPRNVKVISAIKDDRMEEKQNLQADIVFGIGMGIGSKKKISYVKEIAAKIGASICATRSVVDAGWLSYDYQVGLSGRTITPKLYIALGISGAVQHLVGVRSSNYIIAINSDATAPIFDIADIGLVGEVDIILEGLEKRIFGKGEQYV